MKKQLTRLFEYNLWANEAFGEVLTGVPFKNPKILTLISHVANAQIIWLNRVRAAANTTGVWDEYPISQCMRILIENSHEWLKMIEEENDFDRMINYKNTKGVSFETGLSDIIAHVANHGTHHRGQIALLLREEGIAPPVSDLIFFSRA